MCTGIRRHASVDARNLFQPALTSIFFSALRASGVFGSVTVRMPVWNDASILFLSFSIGDDRGN